MSKIERVQTEIEKLKLSREEIENVREWLDGLLEENLEFTGEFKEKIQRGERDIREGRIRIRKPDSE